MGIKDMKGAYILSKIIYKYKKIEKHVIYIIAGSTNSARLTRLSNRKCSLTLRHYKNMSDQSCIHCS